MERRNDEPVDAQAQKVAMVVGLGALAAACTPTVQLQAPKEPITINLNIQADIRVRIEEAAQADIEQNPDIFGE